MLEVPTSPKGVEGEGGAPNFSSCYYVYNQLLAKGLEKQERKLLHIQKSKLRSVQIFEFRCRYVQQT